jgi:ribonuclease III
MVKQKEPYLLLRQILGFYPKNIQLYQQAFRHKSASLRNGDGIRVNNERLEYLGDAVLNVMISDILFKKYPRMGEDFLTRVRALIVQRRTLNRVAIELGLDKYLLSTSLPESFPHQSVYGNALEALIGAVYLDSGYRRCKQFLEDKILNNHINLDKMAHTEENFKSALLEYCQQEKKTLVFETSELQDKRPKEARFLAKAVVDGNNMGEGTGLSKKEAQQRAARKSLEKLRKNK